jgi:hypothetical protein
MVIQRRSIRSWRLEVAGFGCQFAGCESVWLKLTGLVGIRDVMVGIRVKIRLGVRIRLESGFEMAWLGFESIHVESPHWLRL